MSASANPTYALRPFLPSDTPLLAEIFRESIFELTGDDYEPAQQDAWATRADDEEALAERLGSALTLVATVEKSPIGFIALEGAEHIDMLYVHPVVASSGVGTMLCDAIEKLATARGAKRLTVEASDTARGFFEMGGYVATQRNTVMVGGEWLANTTMEKTLTPPGAAGNAS